MQVLCFNYSFAVKTSHPRICGVTHIYTVLSRRVSVLSGFRCGGAGHRTPVQTKFNKNVNKLTLRRSRDSNSDESKGYLILITHSLSIMQSIGLQYITHIPFYALRATLRLPIPPLPLVWLFSSDSQEHLVFSTF